MTLLDAEIIQFFADIEDPRMDRTKKHLLLDILTISLCAFICGVDNWVDVQLFAIAKRDWFHTFLELPNGIPSHDTFGRVFRMLDAETFGRCFSRWVQSIAQATDGQVVAIDGKTLRRSFDASAKKAAIHMVNAWATQNGLSLGQLKTDEKSNEIEAVPRLIDVLHLSGCIVTMDAMNCQKETVKAIVDKQADYIVCLKKNNRNCTMVPNDFFKRFSMEKPPPTSPKHATKTTAELKCASAGQPTDLDSCTVTKTGPACKRLASFKASVTLVKP